MNPAIPTLILPLPRNSQPINRLHNTRPNPPHHQLHRGRILPHLVNGQHAVAHQRRLARRELREHQAGTVAEHDGRREVDRLEVFCFTGRAGHGHFFGTEESVNRAGFTDVRVTDEPDV